MKAIAVIQDAPSAAVQKRLQTWEDGWQPPVRMTGKLEKEGGGLRRAFAPPWRAPGIGPIVQTGAAATPF